MAANGKKICTLGIASEIFCNGKDVWVEVSFFTMGDRSPITSDVTIERVERYAMSRTVEVLQEILDSKEGLSKYRTNRKVN